MRNKNLSGNDLKNLGQDLGRIPEAISEDI